MLVAVAAVVDDVAAVSWSASLATEVLVVPAGRAEPSSLSPEVVAGLLEGSRCDALVVSDGVSVVI